MSDSYLFLAVTVCGFALALSCLGLWIQLGERRRAREASRPDPLPLDPFDPNVPPEPIGVVQYTYAPKPEENVLHPRPPDRPAVSARPLTWWRIEAWLHRVHAGAWLSAVLVAAAFRSEGPAGRIALVAIAAWAGRTIAERSLLLGGIDQPFGVLWVRNGWLGLDDLAGPVCGALVWWALGGGA